MMHHPRVNATMMNMSLSLKLSSTMEATLGTRGRVKAAKATKSTCQAREEKTKTRLANRMS
jgi:hypothetical protein